MVITRVAADIFSVVTDTVLADGSFRADHDMRLRGSVLKSHEQQGHIRVGGLLRVTLGPVALSKITALAIGETLTQA